ncbi:LysR family transcriptional regulator, cyn operon transcriptional activator [Filimonas lacunae]|uniref:LysR family transcriptional regulator, cyn operon transcriptional activator n=1 Tax=Filimonas lacunae TaxID=477680 RepID=A0A173MHZ8_9BACT|nr:LysR substrate-binding domain-containing protein [Filimonas lacunae]BAV07097.1 transcriptional regulator, LysR family [Filimonas lacunae]SIS95029.1 LysR family transcriptional regulator, cyn operon transcriptional activator [Filimonas lacunae]
MELRQLKYYIKAKELENFSEAAEQLFISQSTLSQQIKQLENELGTPLFHRVGKRVHPTEAGIRFYDYALQCLHKANDGFQMVQDLGQIKTGKLHIGCSYGLKHVLAPAIVAFARTYPNIHIQVSFGTSKEITDRLFSFELDFVLTFEFDSIHPEMNYQPLFTSGLRLLTSHTSEIAHRSSVTLADIQQLPLALPAHGYATRHFIDQLFTSHQLTPQVNLEINDIPTLLELVNTGHWHTILTQTTANGQPQFTAIPIEGVNIVQQAAIISLKAAYQKQSAKAFQEILIHQ